jgi:hypothetical protein
MRNLKLISAFIILLVFSSCASLIPAGFHKDKKAESELNKLPAFVNSSSLQKYDMTLDYKKSHFSGMLLLKKMDESSCRLVLTSYLGLSIFNLEISKDKVIVQQCIEPLNKKKILELFASDIEFMMAYEHSPLDKYSVYKSEESNNVIEKISNRYYTIDTAQSRLVRVQQRGFFGKRDIRFFSAKKIVINHPIIGLRLTINSLK